MAIASLPLGTCVALSLSLVLSSCSRCSDEPRVPFKLQPAAETDAPGTGTADAAVPTAQAFEAPQDKLSIAGQSVAISHVRATLEVDLDADGDRDLLALREDDSHKLQLLSSLREANGLSTARVVTGFSEQDLSGCSALRPRFVALSASKATLSVTLSCSVPEGTPRGAPYSSLSLLSLEAVPRVYERIDVTAGDAQGQPALTFSPHSVDADGDGHDDVAITVTGLGAVEPDALELVWLDRPSGLVRDAREPEATLSAWAAAAQSLLAKTPAQATARAELALTLQGAVCREPDRAVLALSGTPGIPCGSMKSTGSLLATSAAGYAKSGEMRAAFDAYRALRHVEPRPSEREIERVTSALQKLPGVPGISLRRGPAVTAVRTPRLHLPSARFLGESTLYLNRLSPVLYDLERNEETAAPTASDQLMRDPSGQLIATTIEHGCDGYAVRIERAPPRGSDYTPSPAVSSAVLLPSATASVPGAACNRSAARGDDGGFTLLGWAPQGLVAARGSDVRLVPLGSDGQATGPVRGLAPDAPRPAPLPSGTATADGARYVEATPFGVLVYGPRSTSVELWRPEGYSAVAGGSLEAAISPLGRKVALVAGSDVYVLEHAP